MNMRTGSISRAGRAGCTVRLGLLLFTLVAVLPAAPLRPEPVPAQRRPVAFRDRVLPAPLNGGFRLSDYWVWCGTVVKGADGKFHHYASRWPQGLPFGPHWLTNSEVVHSVADRPEGPYVFSDVALPPRGPAFWDGRMTHNPVVRKVGEKYLLYYTGTTYAGPTPEPGMPVTEDSALKLDAHDGERVGLATADSPYGPWQRRDQPILDVRPRSWEQYLISNPSPLILPDRSVLLYYKGVEKLRQHAIGVARAATFEGPYERLSDRPFDVGVGAEDPTMWFENGRYHSLMLDHDHRYSNKELYYATSTDGLHWSVEPNPVALTKDYLWSDGLRRRMNSTERPQILVQDGVATHLFFATGETVDSRSRTWSQVVPLRPEAAVPDRAAWWREARFGLFIHWGLYAPAGGFWNGQPLRHDRYANPYCEQLMWLAQIPRTEYAQLAGRFNPTRWDARDVVATAKAAGMKYVVFTAKHHDGFAMYRSAASPFNIDATPFRRDPLRELADACREAGLQLGIYYSLGRDWDTPRTAGASKSNTWDFPGARPEATEYQRYLDEKVKPQVTELLTNYGPVGVLWFDTPERTTVRQSCELELLVRRLSPATVVNTRIGNGVGDYDEMEDNEIPDRPAGRDFEVPATMAESWGYSSLDTPPFWKSSTQLIRHLVDITSKGGNYLLNIGPDGTGAIPAPARERLEAISEWMKVNGESIHGAGASTLRRPEWGRFTQRAGSLYAHVFDWPEHELLLPVHASFIGRIELLTLAGPVAVNFSPAHGAAVLVSRPATLMPHATVLRITLQ